MKKQISILSAMCLALLSGGAASAFANSAHSLNPMQRAQLQPI